MNRPEKRNAMNRQFVDELRHTFETAISDKTCKIIVLKANSPAFCSGADLEYLKELQQFTYEQNLEDSSNLKELFLLIHSCPKVVIAQIEGHALAGGCGLATVCDFGFAVPEAKFGYTEVKIGFIPAIVMVFLIRKIGEGKARELLLTGKSIEAQKAVNFGLINGIFTKETIESEVFLFAEQLAGLASGQSLARIKEMIGKVQDMPLSEALSYAAEQNAKARATDDCIKGIEYFLNKKDLNW